MAATAAAPVAATAAAFISAGLAATAAAVEPVAYLTTNVIHKTKPIPITTIPAIANTSIPLLNCSTAFFIELLVSLSEIVFAIVVSNVLEIFSDIFFTIPS